MHVKRWKSKTVKFSRMAREQQPRASPQPAIATAPYYFRGFRRGLTSIFPWPQIWPVWPSRSPVSRSPAEVAVWSPIRWTLAHDRIRTCNLRLRRPQPKFPKTKAGQPLTTTANPRGASRGAKEFRTIYSETASLARLPTELQGHLRWAVRHHIMPFAFFVRHACYRYGQRFSGPFPRLHVLIRSKRRFAVLSPSRGESPLGCAATRVGLGPFSVFVHPGGPRDNPPVRKQE